MSVKIQTLRSSTKLARPAVNTREPGELFVNYADKQFGVIDTTKNPVDLLPIRFFSATTDYVANDLVARGGKVYVAKAAITAGAWNTTQWNELAPSSTGTPHGVAVFSASSAYAAKALVSYDGEVYRAKAAVTAGTWNPAEWDKITGYSYTLPVATAGAIGGVKANAGTAGQFVSGVGADGSLTYSTPTAYSLPIATTGAIGGVKATAPVAGQFVTGISGTGDLTFAAPTAYTLPIATAAAIGGVKATAPVAGSYVSGVNATTGDLIYTALPAAPTPYTLPAATSTTLGGIKTVATPPAGQFINGFAADGTATYAAPTSGGDAYLGNTQTWTKAQRGNVATTTGSFDFAASNNFYINAGGAAATLANPTNAVTGQSGAVHIDNAASLAFGTSWKFSGGTAPSGSGAGKRDLVVYYVLGPNDIAANLIKGL